MDLVTDPSTSCWIQAHLVPWHWEGPVCVPMELLVPCCGRCCVTSVPFRRQRLFCGYPRPPIQRVLLQPSASMPALWGWGHGGLCCICHCPGAVGGGGLCAPLWGSAVLLGRERGCWGALCLSLSSSWTQRMGRVGRGPWRPSGPTPHDEQRQGPFNPKLLCSFMVRRLTFEDPSSPSIPYLTFEDPSSPSIPYLTFKDPSNLPPLWFCG